MINKLVTCAASLFLTGVGGTHFATPAQAAAAWGECPAKIAQSVVAVAEKQCKQRGGDVLITYLSCEDGVASMSYLCI